QAPAPFLLPAGASNSEVAFLGTGSALPSKYRNVTGMLVRLGGGGGDACHGKEEGAGDKNAGVQQMLRNLSAVWISHPHADHHLGLVRILSERNKLL
ncbi:unnamed protein product, partial [Ectocarpus sp. 8 AP-2014]